MAMPGEGLLIIVNGGLVPSSFYLPSAFPFLPFLPAGGFFRGALGGAVFAPAFAYALVALSPW